MALNTYHHYINKDYFHNILYVKELEKELKINLKEHKLQYNIIEDTLKTLITINNNWCNYGKKEEKFNNAKLVLEDYLKKYKNKIEKSYDLFCIELYDTFSNWYEEIEEIEERGLNKQCNNIKKQASEILTKLIEVNFDYVWNGYFYYYRDPNNKAKKQYFSLLSVCEEVATKFIKDFNKNYGNSREKINIASWYFYYIQNLYTIFGIITIYISMDSHNLALKKIIEFFKDKKPSNLDGLYDEELLKLLDIATMIIDEEYDKAYNKALEFIKANKEYYVVGNLQSQGIQEVYQ